jgi:NhaP-type Na+/H+ or K+/H+ antiporter
VKAMRSTPTWPVAAGSLALGFAVAQATGIRPLGGIVLVAGAGWCALRWREKVGVARAAGLVALYLAAFVASHLLAHAIGAWPSVAVVAAVVAAGSYAVADAAPARRAIGV